MSSDIKPKRNRTERVKLLIENFHSEFMSGLTIGEIEEKYHVSKGYSYNLLDEIAAQNGVDKEIYFQRDHGLHVYTAQDGRILPARSTASFAEIKSNLNDASQKLQVVLDGITTIEALMKADLGPEE